jgi:hypothetical protein
MHHAGSWAWCIMVPWINVSHILQWINVSDTSPCNCEHHSSQTWTLINHFILRGSHGMPVSFSLKVKQTCLSIKLAQWVHAHASLILHQDNNLWLYPEAWCLKPQASSLTRLKPQVISRHHVKVHSWCAESFGGVRGLFSGLLIVQPLRPESNLADWVSQNGEIMFQHSRNTHGHIDAN